MLSAVVTRMLICDLSRYAVGCVRGNKFFHYKIWDQKVHKNDLDFNKQYVKKTDTHFKKM